MPTFVASQIGKGTVLQAPTADGMDGQFIKTDGSGNLSFDAAAGTPAGSDTHVQFNDGGSFGGSANLTWDDATLQVTGTNTTAPVLIAKMPASHADNAFEIQDSTATALFEIDQNGRVDFTANAKSFSFYGGAGETRIDLNSGSAAIGASDDSRLRINAGDTNYGGNGVLHLGNNSQQAMSRVAIGGSTIDGDIGFGHAAEYEPTAVIGFKMSGATPYDGTLIAESGSGTDIAGANLQLAGGRGTGTGAGGHLIFQTAAAGGSGSSLNSLATMLELTDDSKIGFFAATPVIQQAGTGETTGFTAGAGTAVNDDSTFTGNVGSTAYRISDIVKALKNYGLLAS